MRPQLSILVELKINSSFKEPDKMQKLKHYTNFDKLKAVTKKPSTKVKSAPADANAVREFISLLQKNGNRRRVAIIKTELVNDNNL